MRKSIFGLVGISACLVTAFALAGGIPPSFTGSTSTSMQKGPLEPPQQTYSSGACGPQPCLYTENFDTADFTPGVTILGQGVAGGVFETWAVGCNASPTGSICDNTNAFSAPNHLRLRKDNAVPTATGAGCSVAARVPSNGIAEANTPVIGPSTLAHEVAISGLNGSYFNTQPQARWTGLLTDRVVYTFYGNIYVLDAINGVGPGVFGIMGQWDTTGGYQRMLIELDPCNPFKCEGGVDNGLPCTDDADCVGDPNAMPPVADGVCQGHAHYEYDTGGAFASVYEGAMVAGPNQE